MNQDQYDNWRAPSSSGDFTSNKKNEYRDMPNSVKVIIGIIIVIIVYIIIGYILYCFLLTKFYYFIY